MYEIKPECDPKGSIFCFCRTSSGFPLCWEVEELRDLKTSTPTQSVWSCVGITHAVAADVRACTEGGFYDVWVGNSVGNSDGEGNSDVW